MMHLPQLTVLVAVLIAESLLGAQAGDSAQQAVSSGATAGQPPTPIRIEFGERGELIIDGRPRFIRAGYRSGQVDRFVEALPSARAAGFDMVHDYRFEAMEVAKVGIQRYVEEARLYLRQAEELGLGVFLGLPRDAVRAADERALEQIVTALSKERALWMWYIYDEPRSEVLSTDAAARVHALLRRLDPHRPSILLTNRENTMQQYHPYCDVLWFDRYPITATGQQKASLMPTAEVRQAAKRTVPAHKPVWSVLQALDNKGNPKLRRRVGARLPQVDDTNHRPNEAELRAQAHVAIANGAMAAVYYWGPETWYSMRTDTPGIWRSLARVLKELGDLAPVLLAREDATGLVLSGGGGEVMMWSRSHAKRRYVGLVNANIHAPARVLLRAANSGPEFEQVSGDGSVSDGQGGLDVRLGPAGVAVIAVGAG